jgi:PKD repeat protein
VTPRRATLGLVLLALALLLAASWVPRAQTAPAAARLVHVVEANDAGLSESEAAGLLLPARSDLHLELDASRVGSASMVLRDFDAAPDESRGHTVEVVDPINFAFTERPDGSFRLLALDGVRGDLTQVDVADVGKAAGATVTRPSITHWNVIDPLGVTIDPVTGTIFILDGEGPRVVRVSGGVGRDARITEIAVPAGLEALRGIAVNPADGHLHLLSPSAQELYELDAEGRLLALRKLEAAGPLDPQIMAFAASSDRTDDRWETHLFLAAASGSGGESVLTEWSLKAAIRPGKSVAAHEATLVQEIDASAFDPPSPDSAGIAHKQSSDSLLVADSEVDEMSIYGGFNVFELTRSGIRFDRFDTTDFSDEPTGVAINPGNGHCFFSDDTGTRSIYEVDPGPDGRCLTGNDSVTSFSTEEFGSMDPEGVAFGQGALFIVDGVNREVYRVSPGANGVFDGSDDQVSSCDTAALGVDDPAGIGFDESNGSLFIVGRPADQVFQISTQCDLVRIIDISAAHARNPVGLTLAPSSVNPGVTSLWITDAGVDGNAEPDENDGRIYELSLPSATPGNTAPIVSAGPDLDIALGDSALLQGRVSDDGLPSPGSLVRGWNPVSGPGEVTFVDAGQEVTYVSFSAAGTYLLRLTGDDGHLQSIDDAIVAVSHSDGSTVFQRRVEASEDDAEEDDQGIVDRTSTDLALATAGGNRSVGIRFAGVDVPAGATILEATLQLQANEAESGDATLTLEGEAVDHAAPFLEADGNISSRARTREFVSWSPAPWPTVGEAGPDQESPDLSAVIQEIVDRPGWAGGNALALVITGDGTRKAKSFDGRAAGAPLLRVRFANDANAAPSVTIDSPRDGASVSQGDPIAFTGTATDVEDGNSSAALTWVSDLDGVLGSGQAFTIHGLSPGRHTITASVTDRGNRVASDQITLAITLAAPPPLPSDDLVFERRVEASEDDAEEAESGSVNRTSTDLELVFARGDQTVGIRFAGVEVPPGAMILEAYLQLQANEAASDATTLTLEGEAVDHAAPFLEVDGDISSRSRTAAFASWSVAPWSPVGDPGPDQKSPDLSAVVQEIVDRPGWSSGNALAFVITGHGTRTAKSFDGVASGAPLLHVRYSADGNATPSVTIDAPRRGASVPEGAPVSFKGTATDPEDGGLSAALVWVSDLDGVLGNGQAFTIHGLSLGRHTITASVADSLGRAGGDQLVLTVSAAGEAPVLVGAGDIARCGSGGDEATATLLDAIPGTVFTTGDHVYPDGTEAAFAECYEPSWGRHKARTRPTPGNHDYHQDGAAPYFDYFGAAAGEPGKGYYSYDVGAWHVIALNSDCGEIGGCSIDSPQGAWLRADLAANPSACTLAYWHHPRFSSGRHGSSTRYEGFWELLYEAGADVVVNGHDHVYERFAPQDPTGAAHPNGIREFVVGTGGSHLTSFETVEANSEVRESNSFGVLKLTLHPTRYDWEFVSVAGSEFSDFGSAPCVTDAMNVSIGAPSDGARVILGDSVTLTGAATDAQGGDLSENLVWVSNRDGNLGVGASLVVSGLSSGFHTVTATATDSAGLEASDQIAVTVSDTPLQDPTASFAFTCSDLNCSFTDTSRDSDGSIARGAWSFGDGSPLSGIRNPSHRYATGGTYLVTLTVVDDDGRTDTASQQVVASVKNSLPVAAAGPDQTVRVGDTVTLDGGASSDADGDSLSYLWTLTSAPPDSSASLSDATAVRPRFVADVAGAYVAQLIVEDGLAASDPDTVTLSSENSAPVADAGSDQTVRAGRRVTLDGSGSSDADGDPLTYAWSLTTLPSGSNASLSSASAVSPHFVADVAGTYVAELVVHDGLTASAPDTVALSSENTAPVADAGSDRTVRVGEMVTLDAGGSTDADGDSLRYSWTLTSLPAGSGATLFDVETVRPAFVADVAGTYVVQLMVDDGRVVSAPDTVAISSENSPPLAEAGLEQIVRMGETVTLNGGASSDPDGDPLTYAWSFTSVPSGSGASLSDAKDVTARFVADAIGTYVVQLIVDDGRGASLPDTVTILSENSPPVADAGRGQTVHVGERIVLDGRGSNDVDGDALGYTWSVQSAPPGSTASLSDATTPMPSFVVDVVGLYVMQLVVDDGETPGLPDTVLITSENSPPVADAGLDRTVRIGEIVSIDGLGSNDPDGDPLAYIWSFSSVPAGSIAALRGARTATPSFVVDVGGTYGVKLTVSDGWKSSAPDTVQFNVENSLPVADAGPDRTVRVGETMTFDGSGSRDGDGDRLVYAWSFTSVPEGSSASLSDPAAEMPTFVADVAGTYELQLVVDDGRVISAPDTVAVRANERPPPDPNP